MMMMNIFDEALSLQIRDVNDHIVCKLCAGYLVEATTITECLHTFCKSCIVKYLQSSKCCPTCTLKIHETQPLMNLKRDQVMQDIVYKLVPKLYDSEEKRKHEFYKARGLTKQQQNDEENSTSVTNSVYDDPQGHSYSNDVLIAFCLERYSLSAQTEFDFRLQQLPRKFVRCSARVCVFHLRQLLQRKLNIPSHLRAEILCCETPLPEDWCLKRISLFYWHNKDPPLHLYYRLKQVGPSPKKTDQSEPIEAKVSQSQTSLDSQNQAIETKC